MALDDVNGLRYDVGLTREIVLGLAIGCVLKNQIKVKTF